MPNNLAPSYIFSLFALGLGFFATLFFLHSNIGQAHNNHPTYNGRYDESTRIVYQSLALAKGNYLPSIRIDQANDSTGTIGLALIHRLQKHIRIDISTLLADSTNPEQTLTQYINTAYTLIQQSIIKEQELTQEIQSLQGEQSVCQSNKSAHEKTFSEAISYKNDDQATQAIQSAAEQQGCIGQIQTQINALTIVRNQLGQHRKTLEQKRILLQGNQSLIITHLDEFTDLVLNLERIRSLRQQLTTIENS